MPETSKQEIKLFYCYARKDKDLRDELETHLSSLKRLYSLRNWHDREILPGTDWEHAINESLDTAHLILLLVSPDFMNSDYCYGKEMQRALERHEAGTCKVIPIILRPTYLPEDAPFHKLQMLPTDAKPITRWPDRDEAFYDVVQGIGVVLKDLLISLKTKKDWLDEGIAYHNTKRYDYALEAFEQAIRRDPNYLEAYQQKGMTLLELGRYAYALEAFEQALHIDPKLAPLYIAKGQALDALERYEDALSAFEQAIQIDPNLAEGYIGRDKVLRLLGISREAQKRIESQLQGSQQQLANLQKRTEELESRLERIQEQRDEVLGRLGVAKEEREQIGRQLEQTQQQLADLQEQSKQIESELQQTRQQLTDRQKRVGQLESELERTQQQKDETIQELGAATKGQEELTSRLEEIQQQLASEQKRSELLENELREAQQRLAAQQVKKVSPSIAPLAVERLTLLHTLTNHRNGVNGIAISPDGQILVSGSQDNTIKVWNLSTGRELRTLTGNSMVFNVAISPDGQTLISSSWDWTIKVWGAQ